MTYEMDRGVNSPSEDFQVRIGDRVHVESSGDLVEQEDEGLSFMQDLNADGRVVWISDDRKSMKVRDDAGILHDCNSMTTIAIRPVREGQAVLGRALQKELFPFSGESPRLAEQDVFGEVVFFSRDGLTAKVRDSDDIVHNCRLEMLRLCSPQSYEAWKVKSDSLMRSGKFSARSFQDLNEQADRPAGYEE